VAYNAKQDLIVVAFRGSHNIANWISNIDFFKEPYKGSSSMQVHTGFYADYILVAPQVISAVRELINAYPIAGLLYTGHSLGAALVTFAAVDVMEQLNPTAKGHVSYFYSLGSPRTGN
jgi:predicted lipase